VTFREKIEIILFFNTAEKFSMAKTENILQYESNIWATADLLRGCGIKESEWPSFMMPFFALMMIESRLKRLFDELRDDYGDDLATIDRKEIVQLIKDKGQGYNTYIFDKNLTLKDICKNDKSFDKDLDAYLKGFDGETKHLLGVDATEGEKYLDIKGVITKLRTKKVLFAYTKEWSQIDLQPFNNSEITTLEEHIKRRWADISAETAGEQYTPDDVIGLIAEIIATKIDKRSHDLLKIYDCTCGGGNLLFGVEDRIKEKSAEADSEYYTMTFGQDWNDALYALAKIESRFRIDSKIEHGNSLTNDRFYDQLFDVVIANPPYGVSWKGYQKDIENDKTQRFQFLPSVSDGQLLFMQHLISKMADRGVGVVVHNGSSLFSGDAGSAESNIRKWMLDCDLVEAVIQLPTDEFFNTGIYTYLWVLNKHKAAKCKHKVMLINASEKFKALKKNKGSKRKEIDRASCLEIVNTLGKFQDNDYARVFSKEYFYFNKQAILLTNVDENGVSFASQLGDGQASLKLIPLELNTVDSSLTEFTISEYDQRRFNSLEEFWQEDIKPFIDGLDYREQVLVIVVEGAKYWFDRECQTLVRKSFGKRGKVQRDELGCGKIVVRSSWKKATKTLPERIEITVELMADCQKDYEIIPFHKDEKLNKKAINTFMAQYIKKPFILLDNVVGVEINFNKVFYRPELLRDVSDVLADIQNIDLQLKALEQELGL
jgi:type I restriction enzyme M protein